MADSALMADDYHFTKHKLKLHPALHSLSDASKNSLESTVESPVIECTTTRLNNDQAVCDWAGKVMSAGCSNTHQERVKRMRPYAKSG